MPRVNSIDQMLRQAARTQALYTAGEIGHACFVGVMGRLLEAECRMRRAAPWN